MPHSQSADPCSLGHIQGDKAAAGFCGLGRKVWAWEARPGSSPSGTARWAGTPGRTSGEADGSPAVGTSSNDTSWGRGPAWKGSTLPQDAPKPGPCCQAGPQAGLTPASLGRSSIGRALPKHQPALALSGQGDKVKAAKGGWQEAWRQQHPVQAGGPGCCPQAPQETPAQSRWDFGQHQAPHRPSPSVSQPGPAAQEGVVRAKAATLGEPQPGKLVHPQRRR